MNVVLAIARREWSSYFATPLALAFIVIFLMLSGVFTFSLGEFFEAGQADLQSFFRFHPWLYLLLVPAVSMRLWAEERKNGSIEWLLTLPVQPWQAVLGKFLAAWAVLVLALALTFPMWITVNYLGNPDNGVILASYCASALLSAAFLAMGGCLSACTSSQVLAFILTASSGLLFLLAGFNLALDPVRAVFSSAVVDAVAQWSLLTHFQAILRGVLDVRDMLYFAAFVVVWLWATVVVVDMKRGRV